MTDPLIDAKVQALLADFGRSGVRELHIRHGGFELYLSNDGQAPGLSRSPSTSPTSSIVSRASSSGEPTTRTQRSDTDIPVDATVVSAPNLGTFYRSPKPGAAPYVGVGSIVELDDELCLIEVMKLFTTVRAEVAGRIHSVLAADGEMVTAQQPLFAIVNG